MLFAIVQAVLMKASRGARKKGLAADALRLAEWQQLPPRRELASFASALPGPGWLVTVDVHAPVWVPDELEAGEERRADAVRIIERWLVWWDEAGAGAETAGGVPAGAGVFTQQQALEHVRQQGHLLQHPRSPGQRPQEVQQLRGPRRQQWQEEERLLPEQPQAVRSVTLEDSEGASAVGLEAAGAPAAR